MLAFGDATVTNAGLINTAGTSSEIVLEAGGVVTNLASGTIASPSGAGVYLNGTGSAAGILHNAGSILGGNGFVDGVLSLINGYVGNAAGGLITGTAYGVHLFGRAATVVNAGMILGTRPASGLRQTAVGIASTIAGVAGYVTNAAGGVISGAVGVTFSGRPGTIVNAGTIARQHRCGRLQPRLRQPAGHRFRRRVQRRGRRRQHAWFGRRQHPGVHIGQRDAGRFWHVDRQFRIDRR